jgi:hypothetical protein
MKTNTTTKAIIVSIAVLTGLTGWAQNAAKPNNNKMKVKTITIVDGDTTINEQTIDTPDLKDLEKNLDNIKGKNVNVTVMAMAGTDKAMENMDSLMKSMNVEVYTNEAKGGKEQKKKVKKVIIKNGNANTNSSSYSFDTEDAEPGDVIVREIKTEAKDGKKVTVMSTVKVLDSKTTTDKLTSTKKELSLQQLNFYPNPSNGKFSLEFETSDKDPVTIHIMDTNGKEVYNETVKGEEKYKREIELGAASKGIYVINLQQGKRSTSKKIIIE